MTKIPSSLPPIKTCPDPPCFIPISQLCELSGETQRGRIYIFILLNFCREMLGIFSSSIVSPPEELVTAGTRTPSPKITAAALVNRFLQTNASAVSLQIGDHGQLAYTHHNESPWQPRYLLSRSSRSHEIWNTNTKISKINDEASLNRLNSDI